MQQPGLIPNHVYPVSLSSSAGRSTPTPTEGSVRFPLRINALIGRWRLHISNFDDRFQKAFAGEARFNGVWVGEHAGDGMFVGDPVQTHDSFNLSTGGGEYVSPWSEEPLGDDKDALISLGWYGGLGESTLSPAGCFRFTTAEAAGSAAIHGFKRSSYTPFSWWIEVETGANTQAVSMWGDSITTGTGNSLILYDSQLSQFCRTIGAVPVHYSFPGTGMVAWRNPRSRQWRRWGSLSRVDSVIHFMGHNDITPSGSLASMQERFMATIDPLRENVSENVLVASLAPSSNKPPEVNHVRQQYNGWLSECPEGTTDFVDFSGVLADNTDTGLLAPFDCGDHRHLSTAGSTALARELTRKFVDA